MTDPIHFPSRRGRPENGELFDWFEQVIDEGDFRSLFELFMEMGGDEEPNPSVPLLDQLFSTLMIVMGENKESTPTPEEYDQIVTLALKHKLIGETAARTMRSGYNPPRIKPKEPWI